MSVVVYTIARSILDNLNFVIFPLQTAYNLLQSEVSSTVLPMVLKSDVGIGTIFNLWHININLALWGFVDSCNSDLDIITRILDICQELKVCLQ